MEKYNGWANRETWLVNLHFSERLEEYTQDYMDTPDYEAYEISELLKELMEDELETELETVSLFLKDYINLSLINWLELTETYIAEIKENQNRIED